MGGVHQSKQLGRRSSRTVNRSAEETSSRLPAGRENIHRSNPAYFYRDDIDYSSSVIDAGPTNREQQENQVSSTQYNFQNQLRSRGQPI